MHQREGAAAPFVPSARRFSVGRGGGAGSAACACTRARNARAERTKPRKRRSYAEAGVPEHWIVNPMDETITVLTLADDQYTEHGVFARGAQATSRLLEGLTVDVNAVFDAA